MPGCLADLGLASQRGITVFARKFGYPGRIDDGEHVWLTCAGCSDCRELRLNGAILARDPGETFALEVTTLLTARNHLEIVIDAQSDQAGPWEEVAMEIRRDAWLADVKLAPAPGGMSLTGTVVGTSPAPLELYTLADGKHVDYRTIQPTPGGQPFCIEIAGEWALGQILRIELIHISAIWYVVELPIRDWLCA